LQAVMEPHVSIADVAKCVSWSAGLGVQWITVWDAFGELKADSARLSKLVATACRTEDIAVEYRVGGTGRRGRAAAVPPDPPVGTVVVTVLDSTHGRADIVAGAREIAGAHARGELSEADLAALHPDGLAGWLSVDIPQMDLLFKFGDSDVLAGLLPWHIAVTEIVKFGSHRGIDREAFVAGMGVFAGSDRRFGR